MALCVSYFKAIMSSINNAVSWGGGVNIYKRPSQQLDYAHVNTLNRAVGVGMLYWNILLYTC